LTREDEEASLDGFLSEYGPAVARYIRRRVRADDCDDLISEVLSIAWRRFAHVPPGRERAWLYGVSRRVIANYSRGERRRNAFLGRLSMGRPPRPDLVDEVVFEQIGILEPRLLEVLRQLNPDDREVLLLTAWEELDAQEIAVVLSISHSAARKRLSRARERARELYA
jgi:RNA polymerase sigma-70 factor (ECF subfamily)